MQSVRTPLPPVATVISFIDAINRGDVERLAELTSEDHRLQVLDEPSVDGKAANARRGVDTQPRFPST